MCTKDANDAIYSQNNTLRLLFTLRMAKSFCVDSIKSKIKIVKISSQKVFIAFSTT